MALETPDKRFEGLEKDPRFRRPASKKSKTVIDSRFKKVLTDKRFRGSSDKNPRGFAKKADVSVGAKKAKKSGNEDMKKFYHLAEEDEEESATESASEAEGFHWDAVSTSSDDEPVLEDDSVEVAAEDVEDVPLGDSTDRIGVMNCNWDHIGASDLFVLIQSFLDDNAPGRKLKQIAVYKSQFGIDRMAREEMYGPLIEGMPEDDDEDDSLKTKEELKKIDSQRNVAIRKYEELKKMYFYAIAQFDSINTACIVYDELDGVSAGFVSEALDLRFIPDDVQAPDTCSSEATKVPLGYTPPNIEVGALTMQHSKVTCTWDEDTPERKNLMKKLTPAQIADLDLAAYLDSSDDDENDGNSDEDPEERIAALRKALLGAQEDEEADEEEEDQQEEGDMEMSFSRGVELAGKDIATRGASRRTDLSQWEQYLAKKKDAKKMQKGARREKLEAQKTERKTSLRPNPVVSSDDETEIDPSALASDSRMSKLFTNPQFAIDPTHQNFKNTKSSSKK